VYEYVYVINIIIITIVTSSFDRDRRPHLIQHTPKTKARMLILTNGIVLDAALDGVAEPDGLAVSVLVPVGSGVAREVAVPSTPARVVPPSAAAWEADDSLQFSFEVISKKKGRLTLDQLCPA